MAISEITKAQRRHLKPQEDRKFRIVGEGTARETIVPMILLVDSDGYALEALGGRLVIAGYDEASGTLLVSGTVNDPDLYWGPVKELDAVTTDTDGSWRSLPNFRTIAAKFRCAVTDGGQARIVLEGRMDSDDSDPTVIAEQTIVASGADIDESYWLYNFDVVSGAHDPRACGEYRIRVTDVTTATVTGWLIAVRP